LVNLDSILFDLEGKQELSTTSAFNTISQYGTEYRIFSKPIKVGKKGFTLIVITSLDRIYESLAQLRYIMALLIPASLIAAGMIGFYIARRAFRPVRVITNVAAEITSKSLDVRVPVGKSKDELAKLAETFNSMIDRLDRTFRGQQRFVADASHDIRTPLTSVQVELEMLCNRESLSQNIKGILENCLRSLSRLNRLTDNLLILARADSQQLTMLKHPVRLDEIMIECVQQMNSLAKSKNISFLINVDDVIELRADDNLIRRVITNLLDNAIKYSPNDSVVKIDLQLNESTAIMTINNKGVPIPDDHLYKIFDRFQRGDKSRTTQGSGLGLAIVKALTEAHGGTAIIKSNAIDGTTAEISLPL
jgi:heavy metal sensor kinase